MWCPAHNVLEMDGRRTFKIYISLYAQVLYFQFFLYIHLQWNPVNTATNAPKTIGRINEGVLQDDL